MYTHFDHNYDMSYNEIEIFSGNFYHLFSISIYINIFKIEDMFRKLEDHFSSSDKKANIILLVKLIFHIFLSAHIFCCLWILLGMIEMQQKKTNWITLASI